MTYLKMNEKSKKSKNPRVLPQPGPVYKFKKIYPRVSHQRDSGVFGSILVSGSVVLAGLAP